MSRPTSNAVVSVPFHGDVIEAVKTPDDKIMVSLKRVCQSLGLAVETQRRKLSTCGWATALIMSAPDERGRPQRLMMIDHESLPMWLTTIHHSKVRSKRGRCPDVPDRSAATRIFVAS